MSLFKFLGLLLLSLAAMDACASDRTTNSGKLVFEMKDKSVIPGIAISNEDGTDLRMLEERGGNPKWFPSGTKIAFYLTKETGNGNSPAPYEEGRTRIVDLAGNLIKEIPYWVSDIHPDGNRLLVQKVLHYENFWHETTYELGIYDLQMNRYTALFSPEMMPKNLQLLTPTSAKWFPDGKRILFEFLGRQLYLENVPYLGELSLENGEFKLHTLHDVLVSFWGGFDISPDGTKIVLSGSPANNPHKPLALYVFNLENHSVSLLHRERGVASCSSPVWSNDGRLILFDFRMPSDLGSEVSLKIMNEDGTNVRRVFKTGLVHGLWNAVGGTISELKANADWWQLPLR